MLYKSMTLLVFVDLAACVFAINDIVQEDQAAAEQSYRVHGVYPSWYQYGVNAFPLFARFSRPSLSPPPAKYLRLNADRVDYSAASYPSDFFVGVRNVAHPYAIEAAAENQYGAATYSNGVRGYSFAGYPHPGGFGYKTYPYGTYGAVPYVAAPAKA
ncbi:uncharacterized protein LOC124315992 [Daphnia pulicaria]|uniref:uncharacterized protein LOC124315992 n=1 Tax=Daphnia pulicaria TaxID=35523 RepID=UPI001EE9C8B7|nr:uncharacterized protein LOC124315992 [Daphnia pulicaria]